MKEQLFKGEWRLKRYYLHNYYLYDVNDNSRKIGLTNHQYLINFSWKYAIEVKKIRYITFMEHELLKWEFEIMQFNSYESIELNYPFAIDTHSNRLFGTNHSHPVFLHPFMCELK
jgi:hypothetical protein